MEKLNFNQIMEQERLRLSRIFTIGQVDVLHGHRISVLTAVAGYDAYLKGQWDADWNVVETQQYVVHEKKAEVTKGHLVLTQFVGLGFELGAPMGIDVPESLILVKRTFSKSDVLKVASVKPGVRNNDTIITTTDLLGLARKQWQRVDLIAVTEGTVVGFPKQSMW